MAWMALPAERYSAERRQQVVADIERRLLASNDVVGVGIIDNMLLNALGNSSTLVNVTLSAAERNDGLEIDDAAADSGFFSAAGLTLVRGRTFTSADTPDRERVAIVNEAMVQKFWPGQTQSGGRSTPIRTSTRSLAS